VVLSSFCFLKMLLGVSSGGRFLVWGAPFWAGGVLWGGCVCVVGVSVTLAFLVKGDGVGVDRFVDV